jgi:hypothetical protein
VVVTNENETIVDNDELTAFISATLTAIAAAVESASGTALRQHSKGEATFAMPTQVAFDIAVTAKRTTQGGGGLKVQVFSIGGNVGGQHVAESETVSRISFQVPWSYRRTAPIEPIPRNQRGF